MERERRHTPRMRAYLPVRLSGRSQPRIIETLTKDLSTTGCRFLSPTAFPGASELNVEIILAAGHESVALRGRTAWFRIIPLGDQFDVGLTFVDISDNTKRRLSSYLDRLTVKTTPVLA